MKKSKRYLLLVYITIFVIYNLLVWIILPKDSENYWVGFLFTAIVFGICVTLAVLPDKERKSRVDDVVKGMPVALLSAVFLCVQSVLGLIIAFLPGALTKIIVLVEIILQILFCVVVFGLVSGRKYADQVDGSNEQKTNARAYLTGELQQLYRNVNERETRTALIELTDAIKTCDGGRLAASSAQIAETVGQIRNLVIEQRYDEVRDIIRRTTLML